MMSNLGDQITKCFCLSISIVLKLLFFYHDGAQQFHSTTFGEVKFRVHRVIIFANFQGRKRCRGGLEQNIKLIKYIVSAVMLLMLDCLYSIHV